MKYVEISEYSLREAIGNDVFTDVQLELGFSGLIASDLFTPQIGENLKSVLLARFGEETAVWAEVGKEAEEIENFRYRFYGYMFSTAIRWIDRLSLYDESKSKGLLSGVKSTSTNRDYANDAPSIKDPAVEDLSHVSYFTKATGETETDMGTPASRYEEAIKVDGSVYAQWADDIGTHFSLGV